MQNRHLGKLLKRPVSSSRLCCEFLNNTPTQKQVKLMPDGSLPPTYENVRSQSQMARPVQVQRRFYPARGKRALDVVFVLLSLPLIAPVIALVALFVMRDGASAFFGHTRVGRDGKSFRCWKIRTMVPDAEARLEAYLAANPVARREWNENFKLDHDPRITKLGHILRKMSLDELPQLWNILRGEMSIVGPRPVTAKELVRYGAAEHSYCALRPGLTGPWQVSGRNNLSYDERIALDVNYARSLGLWLDIGIILRTVKAVVLRTGQ